LENATLIRKAAIKLAVGKEFKMMALNDRAAVQWETSLN
jgi:hypothetical protein